MKLCALKIDDALCFGNSKLHTSKASDENMLQNVRAILHSVQKKD